MGPSRPVLCVLVDAFRHDYLDSARAPFMSTLAHDGSLGRIRPILGYSDSIRATIFTGVYPDQHGYWMEYCYRPQASAFAPLERLAVLDALPSDFVRRGVKFALSQSLLRALAPRRGYEHLSLRNLPFRALDRFDWTLRAGMTSEGALAMPTLFSRLTDAGAAWAYVDSSRVRQSRLLRRIAELPRDTRFVFVYLHHIDMASHIFGIESPLFWRAVGRTDALLRRVVEAVATRLGEPRIVVFSDHGMSRVDRVVSYPDLWRHPDFPARFVFALDATMVRLWWETDDASLCDEVRTRVEAGAPGRFLSTADRKELHLSFGNRLYGDEVYLLEPGAAIFPNFHSMLKPKAMHAYHPDDPDQHGIVITPPDEPLGEEVELVEIAPLCERLLGTRNGPTAALRRKELTGRA
jgi:hypothetical protein